MQQKKTFEQSVEELENIVKTLEEANLPMENLVALYEKGSELGKQCLAMLEEYEAKLTMLGANKEDSDD